MRTNLLGNVFQGIRAIYGEADEEDVRVGVGEGSQPVVVFLTRSIPQGKLDLFAINLNISDVVLEDGGDVDLGIEESHVLTMHVDFAGN